MLDKMIESKADAAENARRNNFLMTTLFLVAVTLSGAMVYSLYAKPIGALNDNLELSSIVAPIAATEPPPVEIPKNQPNTIQNTKTASETIRVVNQKSIDESPDVPKYVSAAKNQYASRPTGEFKIGKVDLTAGSPNSRNNDGGTIGSPVGIDVAPKQISSADETKEPPPMPKIEPKTPPQPKIKSLGVVNGIAQNLPVPVYPAAAKLIHVAGAVDVQVMIDETGKVTSAKAVSGHSLLRPAAEQAARRAAFSPTTLSRIPVKVTGIIVYNFVAQ